MAAATDSKSVGSNTVPVQVRVPLPFSMKTLEFLEDNDVVLPTDWCRPLDSIYNAGWFKSPYTSTPVNNMGWVRVQEILGFVWFYRTKKYILSSIGIKYEFVRGEIPDESILKYDKSTNSLLRANKQELWIQKAKRLRAISKVAPVID